MKHPSLIEGERERLAEKRVHEPRFVLDGANPPPIRTLLLGVYIFCSAWFGSFALAESQPYTFTTIAGLGGQLGYSDGTNSGARFYTPNSIAKDSAGNLFVGDYGNNRLRKLVRSGNDWIATTIAGPTGIDGPQGIAADAAGNLFVANIYEHTILKLTPVGTNWTMTVIAGLSGEWGNTDGTNNNARFLDPADVAVDAAGNVFVAQSGKVRKITPVSTNWVVTTIAGSPGSSCSNSDGTNTTAHFSQLLGIALDNAGNLYVTDNYCNTIRKIMPVGTNWVVTTIAGLGGTAGSSDGTNKNARFNSPAGIDVDASGTLFVSDANNHTIRKISPSGTNWIVTTIAGLARSSGVSDGTGTAARFSYPYGLVVDGDGTIFLAGNWDHVIRVGQLIPSLGYSFAGNQLTLSWPTAAPNYVLESSGVLGPQAVWSPLTNGIVVSGDSFVRTNDLAAPAAFYRLHKP